MTIDRRAIYDRDGGVCGFCGQAVAVQDLDLDHVIPKALGGVTSPENLRVAHASCNGAAAWKVRKEIGGPRSHAALVDGWRIEVSADLGKRVREMATREHRTLTAQVQLLLMQALANSGERAAA